MYRMIIAFLLVLLIIFAVPVLVYGALSAVTGLQPPGGAPAWFLAGVLVSKAGTALAFVLLFQFARKEFEGFWLAYACIWWLMFVLGEIGQAIGPNYSWAFAGAGIVSEAIYLPAAAWVTQRLIARTPSTT